MAKTRIRRKDLKKPDEFVTTTARALTWMRENARLVGAVGGLFLLVLVVAAAIATYRSTRVRDANADLGRAMASLRADQLDQATTELRGLIERWDSTEIATMAELLEANVLLRAGDADAAVPLLQELQDEPAELEPYLRQQVLYAFGVALEQKEAWADAAKKYGEAATLDGPYTARATVAEGRALERAGEGNRAVEIYRKAYEQFPNLPQRAVLAAKTGN